MGRILPLKHMRMFFLQFSQHVIAMRIVHDLARVPEQVCELLNGPRPRIELLNAGYQIRFFQPACILSVPLVQHGHECIEMLEQEFVSPKVRKCAQKCVLCCIS